MATKKREDQSVAAKLSDEAQDGMDNGFFSQFLHNWVENVSAIYEPAPNPNRCAPVLGVSFDQGTVGEISVYHSCGPAADQLFINAVRAAKRDPTPTSWQGREIPLIFYAGYKH